MPLGAISTYKYYPSQNNTFRSLPGAALSCSAKKVPKECGIGEALRSCSRKNMRPPLCTPPAPHACNYSTGQHCLHREIRQGQRSRSTLPNCEAGRAFYFRRWGIDKGEGGFVKSPPPYLYFLSPISFVQAKEIGPAEHRAVRYGRWQTINI